MPSVDPDNECWVGWSVKLDSYFLGTRTPDGSMFVYPALDEDPQLLTVPALMVTTAAGVRWGEVSPLVIAELHSAPTLAYLDNVPLSPRDQLVARALRVALAS